MHKVLIDTNILVDHLQGRPDATNMIKSFILDGSKLYCSVVTRTELMTGMRPGEFNQIEALLDLFEEIDVSKFISTSAGYYMNQFYKSHGISIADAYIAASAKMLDADLYTLNKKHFPMDDISIIVPYT